MLLLQDEFIKVLELTLIVSTTHFQYDTPFYKQANEYIMGAIISNVIAKLMLEDWKETD